MPLTIPGPMVLPLLVTLAASGTPSRPADVDVRAGARAGRESCIVTNASGSARITRRVVARRGCASEEGGYVEDVALYLSAPAEVQVAVVSGDTVGLAVFEGDEESADYVRTGNQWQHARNAAVLTRRLPRGSHLIRLESYRSRPTPSYTLSIAVNEAARQQGTCNVRDAIKLYVDHLTSGPANEDAACWWRRHLTRISHLDVPTETDLALELRGQGGPTAIGVLRADAAGQGGDVMPLATGGAGRPTRLTTTVAPGRYYIFWGTGTQPGEPQYQASFHPAEPLASTAPPDCGRPGTHQPLVPGTPLRSRLLRGLTCRVEYQDVVRHSMTVTTRRLVRLNATSRVFRPTLTLRDMAGNDIGVARDTTPRSASLAVVLDPGQYIVQLGSRSPGENGSYVITADLLAPPADSAPRAALPICTLPTTATDTVIRRRSVGLGPRGRDNCIRSRTDSSYAAVVSFAVTRERDVSLSVSSGIRGAYPRFALLDANGGMLVDQTAPPARWEGEGSHWFTRRLRPGTYHLMLVHQRSEQGTVVSVGVHP